MNQTTNQTRTRSGYKGVSLFTAVKTSRPWMAKIGFNFKTIHIGYFDCPEDAARAYDAKAIELFGEFAKLNFPPPATSVRPAHAKKRQHKSESASAHSH